MPLRPVRLTGADLTPRFEAVREELGVPGDFDHAAAQAADEAAPDLSAYDDATDLALVTIDPPGSRDLDQALHVARAGAGFRLTYAIADVGAFVAPGRAVDVAAHARGETYYSPDRRTPLHPPVLSEGAASLLPGETRPAVVWRFDLDADGEPRSVDVRRRMVRSRAKLDYPSVQRALDDGSADEVLTLLRDVGRLRQAREVERGGVSLAVPEQEVVCEGERWTLEYRAPLPVEEWNAQVSLLTGMTAAGLMLDGGVGVLRTMPAADDGVVTSLRRSALALGVDWPDGTAYADVIRRLDARIPAHAALLRMATAVFRGAGYTAFDGTPPAGDAARHAAIAAPYAHATAPLRRLVDRYVSECCVALCAGREVPAWVREALPALPDEMAEADRRAHALDRAVVDLVEAALLSGRVGDDFEGVIVEARGERGEVQVTTPAVRADCEGALTLGAAVVARLVRADLDERKVVFSVEDRQIARAE